MKKLLIINASARTLRSHSRELTGVFVEQWKKRFPASNIIFRELGNAEVPHMTEKWISAALKPKESRTGEDLHILETSDTFVSELKEADVIVIGSPMYNWSIPSPLKAYIDQVMRVNETFRPNRADKQNPYTGLLQNKTLVLLLSRGSVGYAPGEANEHMNFQDNYLKTVFGVMGISDVHLIAIEGASAPSEELVKSIACARNEIGSFFDCYHDTEAIHLTINQ